MRAASTGGGLVRLVVIWLVVLAAPVMTAAGASSTSTAAAAASATVTATATVAAAAAAAAAATSAHKNGSSPTSATSGGAAAEKAANRALAAANAMPGNGACELVRVSLREPPCTGQISEGPGPPRPTPPTPPTPPPRCPAGSCADHFDDNVNVNNDNNKNVNNVNYNNVNYKNIKNNSNHQCLEYARRELMSEMCPDDPYAYRRPGRLSRYRLRHCCHHTVESVVQTPYTDKESCDEQVNNALHMDEVAAAMSCQFDEVLRRYDCQQKYSAKSCNSCKDAYALWTCTAVLPYWTRSTAEQGLRYRVKACRSVCLKAEQNCPWLLPVADDANPYAGEAAFTCIDPDMGYHMSLTGVKEDCCYEHRADGLRVRNASLCDSMVTKSGGGGGGGVGPSAYVDRRPVCVDTNGKNADVDDSECYDYGQDGSADGDSGGGGGGGGVRTASAIAFPVLFLTSSLLARTSLTAAVT